MLEYARFYFFYHSSYLKLARIFIFILFFLLLVTELPFGVFPRIPFSLFLFFLIIEIFFHFKIAKIRPKIDVFSNKSENIYQSFTLPALKLYMVQNSKELLKAILDEKQIKFILQKADIEKKDLDLIEISVEELGSFAFNLAKEIKGKFVTTMDIFAAYILLIEPQTKILFSKKLKKEEFLNILHWARFKFTKEENPSKTQIIFWGEGIGDEWVTGWTLETKKYTIDITKRILQKNPILVGRDEEYQEVIEALHKEEKNNVLIVGEAGTGKTTLVENLAMDCFLGRLPRNFPHYRFFELMVGALLAGVSSQGGLESRLEAIVAEISHAHNIIIYIPEFQNVVGASTFHADLSGALLPYSKNGKIPIIATINPGNYKKFVETNSALFSVFNIIKLEEPDKPTAIRMLLEKADSIEKKTKVELTYRAIVAAIEYANKYMQGRSLPGTAVFLIEDTVSRVFLSGKKKVEEEDVIKTVEEKNKISVAAPVGEEKELLLHFEDKLHERIIDQEEAVVGISEAMRRVRTGLSSKDRPISFLFLGPTGVGKTETAKALASLYFKSEEKMIRLDMSEYTTEDGVKRLLGAPPGEGEEKGELTDKVFDNPFSLVLLDEFEKANQKILDLFLQVLEDGRLTDNKGKTVSFVNNIIIATSNAGSEFIREEISKNTLVDKNFQKNLLDLLQKKGIFKPELLNRFDAVVVFKPLGENEVIAITKILLDKVKKKLIEQDIKLDFDEKIAIKIAKESFDREFGARPIRRFIQDNIEDLIAQKILKEEVKRGDNVTLSTDDANNIALAVN